MTQKRNRKEIQDYLQQNRNRVYEEDAKLLGMFTERRGVTTPPKGVVLIDTDTGVPYVGDGNTQGGIPVGLGSATVVPVIPGDSIKEAIDAITDASASKRYVVKVAPGTYVEQNPITMKEYVNVIGESRNSTIIQAANSATLIIMADNSLLSKVGLIGGASSVVIDACINGVCAIDRVGLFGGDIGINIDDATADIAVTDITVVGSGTRVLNLVAGKCDVRDINVTSLAAYDEIFHVENPTASLTGYGLIDTSGSCVRAISVTAGGLIEFRTGSIFQADTGVYLEDCGATVNEFLFSECTLGIENVTGAAFANMLNTSFFACTHNVSILSSTSRIAGSGVSDSDKMNFHPDAVVVAAFVNEKEGDEGFVITKELHVGNPAKGAESCLGEGDSYTQNMMVYTFDGSSYVDVSVNARSASASTFAYPNTNVNSAIYVASDFFGFASVLDVLPHYGIKTGTQTAHDGTGEIIAEYWNGASWIEVNTMSVESSAPYSSDASELFEHAGSHQVFFDSALVVDSWSKNDPVGYGKDLYWIRYRITTALNTAPVFEQFKLHTNNYQIEADGWVNYYGSSRPFRSLPWDLGLLQAANSSPSNADMYLSDNLGIGRIENRFANGAVDRSGFSKRLPLDCDTSSKIKFKVCVRADGSSGGNYHLTVRHAFLTPGGDVWDGTAGAPSTHPTEIEQVQVVAAPATENATTWYEWELDVSDMKASRDAGFPDVLFVTIERDGGDAADTNSNNMDLVEISGDYVAWNGGGHVTIS